eukprot:g65.t1
MEEKPTWNDAHDVIVGLRDLYNKEDDSALIKQISSLRKQIMESANKKHVTAKEAIRALTERIEDSKAKIERDRRARISEKLIPIESKNAELETKVGNLSAEVKSTTMDIAALEEREAVIISELKEVEASAEVETRRLRNTVSLFVNSCSVGWDRSAPNKVFCTNKDSSSVCTLDLTSDMSEFEVANKMWEMMGC